MIKSQQFYLSSLIYIIGDISKAKLAFINFSMQPDNNLKGS